MAGAEGLLWYASQLSRSSPATTYRPSGTTAAGDEGSAQPHPSLCTQTRRAVGLKRVAVGAGSTRHPTSTTAFSGAAWLLAGPRTRGAVPGSGSTSRPVDRELSAAAETCCDPADESREGPICPECHLPIGDWWYLAGNADGAAVHGECKAQLMLRSIHERDRAKRDQEAAAKRSQREKYGIGWKADKIPSSASVARKLACDPLPHGSMCCLVLEKSTRRVRVSPTIDPALSVNLEYLAIAIQVRRKEGREPFFSLEPADHAASNGCDAGSQEAVQVKRFVPDWLAGTSAGEVMFQADYHLKELCMGEFQQPVVGLRNCFDLSSASTDLDWRGRVWYVVRKAEVSITDFNALRPCVQMAVEAREQVAGPSGVEDARITCEGHPLVRYSAAFTHFFDLIAERKSVVHHLRELAKAAVLAKFLFEHGAHLEDKWFHLAEITHNNDAAPLQAPAAPLQVPQVWNERVRSELRVEAGEIVEASRGSCARRHGLYGGVEFGLERMVRPIAIKQRLVTTAFRAEDVFGRAVVGKPMRAALAPAPAAVSMVPAAASIAAVGLPLGALFRQPQGVDLSLDCFDLSSPSSGVSSSGGAHTSRGAAPLGGAFWAALESGSSGASALAAEDRAFFCSLFHPQISDRRLEGAQFVPPDPDPDYICRLRGLLAEEKAVRKQRVAHFLSADFVPDSPGPLFPSSWTSSCAIARPQEEGNGDAPLRCRVPDAREAAALAQEVRHATAIFSQRSEDGARFRICQLGDLQVRCMQEDGAEEVVRAVCSRRPVCDQSAHAAEPSQIMDDCIVKVAEYVERDQTTRGTRARPAAGSDARSARARSKPKALWRYYITLETETGHRVLTEKLQEWGSVVWVQDPEHLDARNAAARLTGSVDCRGTGLAVRDAKGLQAREAREAEPFASAAACRRYARGMYQLALSACARRWATLTEAQRRAARELGVHLGEGWSCDEQRRSLLSWQDMAEEQRQAAAELGLDETSWNELRSAAGAVEP